MFENCPSCTPRKDKKIDFVKLFIKDIIDSLSYMDSISIIIFSGESTSIKDFTIVSEANK